MKQKIEGGKHCRFEDCQCEGRVKHPTTPIQETKELAIEYALLKGLKDKNYEQLRRLEKLEELIKPK